MMPFFDWVISLRGWRFGVTHDAVFNNGTLYLERWIIWLGFTLRLHKFHSGDDDRAFHDHPWWFITVPLSTYIEQTPGAAVHQVKRWRPHFRPASYRHIVQLVGGQPVWTVILTGTKSNEWGFWDDHQFVHHEQWLKNRKTDSGSPRTAN